MSGVERLSPRERVRRECDRRGESAVVAGCIELLERRAVDDAFVLALVGPAAEQVLAGREGGRHGYWPRVWAARGLLYAWDERAVPSVVGASADEAWRVREMALKVIARRRVGEATEAAARLQADPVVRVQQAARRALAVLTATRA